MRLLLDTCTLLWFLRDDPELSEAAAIAIEDPANEVFVSAVNICEIAIIAGLGKIKASDLLEIGLEQKLESNGFTILSVNYRHAAGVYKLPRVHSDPFDRLLISQCHEEKLVPLTNDSHWSTPEYGLKVLW